MLPGEDLLAWAAAPTIAARAGTPIRLPNLAKPIGRYPSIWHGLGIQRAMATVSQIRQHVASLQSRPRGQSAVTRWLPRRGCRGARCRRTGPRRCRGGRQRFDRRWFACRCHPAVVDGDEDLGVAPAYRGVIAVGEACLSGGVVGAFCTTPHAGSRRGDHEASVSRRQPWRATPPGLGRSRRGGGFR